MTQLSRFRIRAFEPGDQAAAESLVLQGLGEHFGFIDPTLNSDLYDIALHYLARGQLFVVVEQGGHIVGTGALIDESNDAGRLVRMSVAKSARGQGIGRELVDHLERAALAKGFRRLVCETNHDWEDAIGLYCACGFSETGCRDGDRHFEKEIRSGK